VELASVDWWIGVDVKSGELALAMARHSNRGKSALIMHMSYDDYQYARHPDGETATRAVRRQREAFAAADMAFAVGPLLSDRVHQLRSTSSCTKDDHRAATMGVEEKQPRFQFAFFLRCKTGNDGQ
jgi:hypothetical protein